MLELLHQKLNFFPYRTCGGDTSLGYYGCDGTITYKETIVTGDSAIRAFYYHEPSDQFVLAALMDNYEYPGWRYNVYLIDARTGNINRTFTGYGGIGAALQLVNQGPLANGAQGKIYSWINAGPDYGVMENSQWSFGIYTPYELDHPILTTANVSDMTVGLFGPIISWKNGLFLHNPLATRILETWNFRTNTKLHEAVLPEAWPWGTCWEDDERCWFLAGDEIFTPSASTYQTVIKYNYKHNQIELLTELQQQSPADNRARIGFDTRRKKLVAIRFKDDGVDGAPHNSYEVYAPQPVMSALTIPVNIDLIKPNGGRSHFLTTLRGTRGESGANRLLTVTNSGDGVVTQNEVFTGRFGTATIEYNGPDPAASDTLTVSYNETRST